MGQNGFSAETLSSRSLSKNVEIKVECEALHKYFDDN
jgi:hypothetical protein